MRHIASIGQLAAFAALITAAGAATPPTQVVPLIGPAFLSNFDPTNSDAIKNATEAFPKAIENLFDSGALNKTDLVFAVDVFSAATNSSLFSYQHVGEGQEQVLTAGKVDDQTIGRTGSVTKLFTAYALLVKAGIGIFDVPVTHYLPELRRVPSAGEDGEDDLIERIRWEEITIGALASHQAGSGGGGALFAENLGEEESMTPEGMQSSAATCQQALGYTTPVLTYTSCQMQICSLTCVTSNTRSYPPTETPCTRTPAISFSAKCSLVSQARATAMRSRRFSASPWGWSTSL